MAQQQGVLRSLLWCKSPYQGIQLLGIQSSAASSSLSEVKPSDRASESWNTAVVAI